MHAFGSAGSYAHIGRMRELNVPLNLVYSTRSTDMNRNNNQSSGQHAELVILVLSLFIPSICSRDSVRPGGLAQIRQNAPLMGICQLHT